MKRILFAFVFAALSAASLQGIIVSNGPLELHEAAAAEADIGTLQDRVVRCFFPSLPQSSEAFLSFPNGVFNRKVFASALAEETGNIEVGIDNLGDHIDDPSHGSSTLTATSKYVAQIVNNQDDPLRIDFEFLLPGGTITLLDPSLSNEAVGVSADVRVRIHYTIGIADPVLAFDYGLQAMMSKSHVVTTPTGAVKFHDTSDPADPSITTFSIDPFAGTVSFPEIPAHQVLLIEYEMEAHGQTVDPETGFLAKLGDPLDLTAADAPRILVFKTGVAPQALGVDPAAGADSDGNGVFEPGETVRVEPSWQNTGDVGLVVTGSGEQATGPAGATYATDDAVGAYGTVLSDATQSCAATGDCYAVSVSDPSARPAGHWDAALPETVEPGTVPKSWRLHVGDSFTDVPRSQPFYKKIETVFHQGITQGCSPTQYCPNDDVSRSQMAIFLARALARGQTLPAQGSVGADPYDCSSGGVSLFTDVSPTDPACKGVHRIASQQVTSGCAPSLFCPTPNVTRAEMAIFLAKAIVAPNGGATVPAAYGPDPVTGLSYSCDAGSPSLHFTDVSASDSFCKHVHFLWARGFIGGCSATEYCPTSEVTRDQMAKFLANAFELRLYGP